MNSAPVESSTSTDNSSPSVNGWSRGKLLAAITVVFLFQIVMIYWLQGRTAEPLRKVAAAPVIRWTANGPGEWLTLQDPTLFALPHRESFSGEAWLKPFKPAFRPSLWSEPTRPLRLAVENLGAMFAQFVQTNSPRLFANSLADSEISTEPASAQPMITSSTFFVEGDLASRRLVSSFQLRSWPNGDLLANSVVQVLVNARGETVSASLLPPGCGWAGTGNGPDEFALDLARSARFAPESNEIDSREATVTVGTIVFEWQTLPLPSTNAPVAAP